MSADLVILSFCDGTSGSEFFFEEVTDDFFPKRFSVVVEKGW